MVLVPALITQIWLAPTAAIPWGWFSPLPESGLPAALPSGLNSETALALLLATQTCELPDTLTTAAPSGALSPLPVSGLPAEVPSRLNSERVLVLMLGIQTWEPTWARPLGVLRLLPATVARATGVAPGAGVVVVVAVGAGCGVLVAVACGVLVGVAVGGRGVLVDVAVGGRGVLVGVGLGATD